METIYIITTALLLGFITYHLAFEKEKPAKKLPVSQVYAKWVNKNWRKLSSDEQHNLLLYSDIVGPKSYRSILQYNLYIEYLYNKYNL